MQILVIRPGAIGDTLLTFPVLKVLRTRYAKPHITLVGNAAVLPLALASGIVEEVSDYGHPQWSELFSTEGVHTLALRDLLQHTNLAICWLRDPDGVVEQNLRMAGIKRVIVAPGRPPEGMRIHVVEYLAETLALQNVEGQFIAPISMHLTASNVLPSHNQYIAIHHGSGGAHKCWPAPYFAVVIERLWRRNCPVLLLAGPADHEHLRDVLNHLSSASSEMLKVLADAPLLEVAEHLQKCRCYLGNDSGITHLAAMLGVPTVALFGPSDPLVWRPLGPVVRIIEERHLERLHVDTVLETLESFYLNRNI